MKIISSVAFLVFSIVFSCNLTAQERMIAKIFETRGAEKPLPFLNDYFYDELTYAKVDRNTTYFKLKGPAKSVEETTYYIQNDTISSILNKSNLYFNIKQQLIQFTQGETDKTGVWNIEEYFYKDDKLVKRKKRQAVYKDLSQSTYKYDKNGYLVEQTDSFARKFTREKEVYHYKTKYHFFKDYTGVTTHYVPVTKVFPDLKNIRIDFKFDEYSRYKNPSVAEIKYDSLKRPVYYFINNGCGTNSALCIEVTIKYDSAGNIIEQIVWDKTTRNALWSFSTHFQAKYNHDGLIIEKKNFPEDFLSLRLLQDNSSEPKFYMEYYKYTFDKRKNWTKMEIFDDNNKLRSFTERRIIYY